MLSRLGQNKLSTDQTRQNTDWMEANFHCQMDFIIYTSHFSFLRQRRKGKKKKGGYVEQLLQWVVKSSSVYRARSPFVMFYSVFRIGIRHAHELDSFP